MPDPLWDQEATKALATGHQQSANQSQAEIREAQKTLGRWQKTFPIQNLWKSMKNCRLWTIVGMIFGSFFHWFSIGNVLIPHTRWALDCEHFLYWNSRFAFQKWATVDDMFGSRPSKKVEKLVQNQQFYRAGSCWCEINNEEKKKRHKRSASCILY